MSNCKLQPPPFLSDQDQSNNYPLISADHHPPMALNSVELRPSTSSATAAAMMDQEPGPSSITAREDDAISNNNAHFHPPLSSSFRFAADRSTLAMGMSGDQALLRLLAIGGALFLCGLYLLHIVAICYGRYRLHRTPKPLQPPGRRKLISNHNNEQPLEWPGVSILKPLVGADEHLAQNLESFFRLDYPQFELLFCLNSSEDPACRVVEMLSERYPQVQVRVFIGGERVGLNPKINNMYPGYNASRYPLVLVSDQNIFMHDQALRDMVATMLERPNVALVTQPPYCRDRGPGFAAALEQVYFGGAHSRIYLASHAFGFVCSTGMSSLMVREVVEQCGGFKQFSAYLAEDYFLGQAFVKGGYHNMIAHMPALQNAANPTVWDFQERICRWIKLRIAMLPHTMLLEPAQECVVASVIGALSVAQLFGVSSLPLFLAIHFPYWCLCDYLLLRTVQNGPLPFSLATFLACWAFRELSAFPIFVKAVLNPRIGWRFGSYRLCWGGRIKPPPKQK